MKLNIAPARDGLQWARLGLQTFFRQPLALSGLFFLFMAALSVASMIPLLGAILAPVLIPALTLGLMAATREASEGRFPMPHVLISAFRTDRPRRRAMLGLGLIYAAGSLLVFSLSLLIDGEQFAQLGQAADAKALEALISTPEFQAAMRRVVLFHLPLLLMFWHAPALVHWHGVPMIKSLFFSLVACLRNWRAFLVYGAVWVGVIFLASMLIGLVAMLLGGPIIASTIFAPFALLVSAVFFTSLYFSFRGCFVDDGTQPG